RRTRFPYPPLFRSWNSSASAKAYPVARTRPAATVDFPEPEIPMTTMWVVLIVVPLCIMGSRHVVAGTRYPVARTQCSPVQVTGTGSRYWVRIFTTQHGSTATFGTGARPSLTPDRRATVPD